MTIAPKQFESADELAAELVQALGSRLVLAMPLGLGKANHIANALYSRVAADPVLHLNIFSALTLEKPRPASDLERRFIGPVIERLFGGYPELAYVQALRHRTLPSNIEVNEFFFLAGRWLSVPVAQQSYISANYTHAAGAVLARGMNVVAQLVAKRVVKGETFYSLSCNTDITLDLLRARAKGQAKFLLVGQVNSQLPFMPGEGVLPAAEFSHILESADTDFPLFAPPKEPVALTEYAIGFHVARLIPDGGTLQIGIGQQGDAAAQALILRHRENRAFREALERLFPDVQRQYLHHDGSFVDGLHGMSEMFVDAFLPLIEAGVLKREVRGALLRAAFFVGTKAFYAALREMAHADLAKLQMTSVSFTNELYGDEEAKRKDRVKARFVNSAMMVTLLGAVVSDALQDGKVVSGVGGQYNFVSQAFALEDARSIISVRSTRTSGGRTASNILWSYGHETIPRHLRDIVVTEYGVADLRGKSDREVIAAMLSVADSRFQNTLLQQAKDADKIEKTYEIPSAHLQNTPFRIASSLSPLRRRGLLPSFPFGTDFSDVEQLLIPALQEIKDRATSPTRRARLALRGMRSKGISVSQQVGLERLRLTSPRNAMDRFYAALVLGALRTVADD